MQPPEKIVGLERFTREILPGLRATGRKIAFTNGCFDLLHVGHVRYLRQSRACADFLVVGLNTDESVRLLKGPGRPLVPEEERAEVLAALECVDCVILFGDSTPARLIEAIVPDVLTKGGDYTVETVVGHETVQKAGGKVLIIPFVPGRSTTAMLEKLKNA